MTDSFDFRAYSGAEIPHDDTVADGVDAHWLISRDMHAGTDKHTGEALADAIAQVLVINSIVNQHCPPAVLALVVAHLGREIPGVGDEALRKRARAHVIHEIQTVLDAMRREEI
jgi:hypothetical protein